jgi:predicted pyridoxine 5'-phosphate oxidase superfamily flavin-nucleotide-binding protein
MRREVTTVDDLRAIVGHPNSYVANKVGTRLSAVQQNWLAHSPLGFVATTDANGRVDVSPKGDPPRVRARHRRHHDRDPGAAWQ